MLHLVQQVDNDVGLGDAESIEVLPHSQCQLILVGSTLCLGSGHGGGEASDTATEHNVAKGVLERGRGIESVRTSVGL
jgi:hypothetical protein